LNDAPHAQLSDLVPLSPFSAPELDAAAQDLAGRGLVLQEAGNSWELTRPGCAALHRIQRARRAHLDALFAQWSPEQQSELAQLVQRLAPQLVPPSREVAA
jgi:hypothetical protein